MSDRQSPRVFLVGAGPGHPGLLTLRAAECLARADLVLYDRLVPVRCLDLARPEAERICVLELAGRHVDRCALVHETMIDAARQGKCVVRLKGGDPFVFGRGGEEAEALRAAGIAYEVVPGVTAGLAAAAYAGIPLTHRAHTSAIALVTGHENAAKPHSALDWAALARFPGTLVVYMGVSHLAQIVDSLLQNGKDARTPCAVVQSATTGHQRTVEASLGDLPATVRAAEIAAPAIVLIGPVVELRSRLAWFEDRPLFGKYVLVTRPRHQAGEMLSSLEQLGAVALLLPALGVREPADWSTVDRALANLGVYQWLVFTSVNGVNALLRRLEYLGRDLRALGGLQLAAIGPGTADALRHYHLQPDVVPQAYCSEGLAASLKEKVGGQRVLLARADRGRDLLKQELSAVATVDQIAVYTQVDAVDGDSEILDCLRQGAIDYVTVTSSNVARALARRLDAQCRRQIEVGKVKLVSISPTTSAAMRDLNLTVAAEAKEYSPAGVITALVALAGKEESTITADRSAHPTQDSLPGHSRQ